MNNEDKRLKTIRSHTVNIVAAAWVLVALGLIAAYFGFRAVMMKNGGFSLDNLALYGSYLQGSTAALWSLAGFCLIYVAFLSQREQLIKQDQELEEQQEQFRLQQESIKRQSFESTLFQMLNLQNQLLTTIKYGDHKGRDCFDYIYSGFGGEFDQWLRRQGIQNPQQHMSDEVLTRQFCDWFFNARQSVFAHYFRNLYHVFKLVKLSSIEPKRQYTSLARAQLSNYELVFLFYNCLSARGKNFKPLVEEFGLLEHVDVSSLLHPEHKKFFAQTAFE